MDCKSRWMLLQVERRAPPSFRSSLKSIPARMSSNQQLLEVARQLDQAHAAELQEGQAALLAARPVGRAPGPALRSLRAPQRRCQRICFPQ